jgi:ribosomal protein L20A (L18A)
MKWNVIGNVKLGKANRKFSKSVEAASENAAKNKVCALFGSVNGVRRSNVKIETIEKSGA